MVLIRIALVTFLCTASIAAQTAPKAAPSVLDGVYTSAQARRGQEDFEQHCAGCHRRDLGGMQGPALKGERFLDHWREFPLEVLIEDMRKQMPQGNPGTLPPSTYIDIAAYLLEANGVPAGPEQLTQEVAARTRFVAPGGPRPLPTSSPALVVGCMTKETGTGWFLTSASEPARTLNPYEFTDAELAATREIALGPGLLKLQDLESLDGSTAPRDSLVGQRVVAKGILVRAETGTRLNVASLRPLGDACEPANELRR